MKRQKPCSEQSTQSAASMKGALLVLALMVTRELTFEMREGRKEGPVGPPVILSAQSGRALTLEPG